MARAIADISAVTSPATQPTTPTRLRLPADVGGCLKRAIGLMQSSRFDEALDWLAAAAVADIQMHQLAFLGTAQGSGFFADQYARCLGGMTLDVNSKAEIAGTAGSAEGSRGDVRARRVLYIVPSIAPGQAASNRLVRLVETHDRARVEPWVLIAEEFCARRPAVEAVRWPEAPSRVHGAELVSRIEGSAAGLLIAPTIGSYAQGAREIIRMARAVRADAAVFIASPACPMQAAAAFARVAPVQINQNIGTPLLCPGIDAVIYHNESAARADAESLAARNIELRIAPSVGTDLAAASRATATARAVLGVPAGATMLVSAANKLPQRMLAGGFGEDLALFMEAHPGAWWVGVGRGDFTEALGPLRARGVDGRVRLLGALDDIRPVLKAADVFLNEYPEGGCNTVLEAMACGVATAALRAGPAHAAHVGAELVGPAYEAATREAYWARVAAWCADASARREAADAMRARATTLFDASKLTRAYEAIYEELIEGRSSIARG